VRSGNDDCDRADLSAERLTVPTSNKDLIIPSISTLTKNSSIEEKIILFTSLFRGRDDVHACRWVSRKTGDSGYSPACNNFWVQGCNRKNKKPCFDCTISDYIALTNTMIEKHLHLKEAGEQDVIGIYPLLDDNTTWLLAIDFDGKTWKSDAYALHHVATQQGLFSVIERSRSGQGAHVWLFFIESISAKTARRLGSALLTLAMDGHPTLLIPFSAQWRIEL
jgi:hypothetical protein